MKSDMDKLMLRAGRILQAIEGQRVVVQNVAPCWNGREGVIDRWLHDNWYIVNVDGTELVLDARRSEFERKRKEGE